MSKYETWEIVNQCKGLYLSWEGKNEDDSHTFVFKNRLTSFTLTVKSYWKIRYYAALYYESVDYSKHANDNFLLKHAGSNLQVTEVSIKDNYELSFLLKGKIELVIPTYKQSKGAHYLHLPPEWVLKEGDNFIAQSSNFK